MLSASQSLGNHSSPVTDTEVPKVCPPHPIAHMAISAFRVCPQVIPMQETLEVRLKESTYRTGTASWPYKMDTNQSNEQQGDDKHQYVDAANDANSEDDSSQQRPYSNNASSMVLLSQPANNYATTSQASQHNIHKFTRLKSLCSFSRSITKTIFCW